MKRDRREKRLDLLLSFEIDLEVEESPTKARWETARVGETYPVEEIILFYGGMRTIRDFEQIGLTNGYADITFSSEWPWRKVRWPCATLDVSSEPLGTRRGSRC